MSEESKEPSLAVAWARAMRMTCPRGGDLCGADSVAGECVNAGCPHEADGQPMRVPMFMLHAARRASTEALAKCDPKEGLDRFAARLSLELARILGPAPEPKGTAHPLPGGVGFTMVVFRADQVPAGSQVYLRPML